MYKFSTTGHIQSYLICSIKKRHSTNTPWDSRANTEYYVYCLQCENDLLMQAIYNGYNVTYLLNFRLKSFVNVTKIRLDNLL